MQVEKRLSVKEFTELVGHHSVSNVRVFRERLRNFGVIKNNEPLRESFVPIWEEICKVHEEGLTWVEAMDHVISNQSKVVQTTEEKLDEIIDLLKKILVEVKKER